MTDAKTTSDAEVLFAGEEITIGGETIMVREFRYLEGLKATAIARPILAGLRALIEARADFAPEALDALISEHHEAWLALISMSTGRPVEWIATLNDKAGIALSLTFWSVNGPFFTRRLVLAGALAAELGKLSRSRKSSPSSSPADSAEITATSASA
jgi:hypothetical protein